MSLENAKQFLHDKIERLEDLGEEFLNDLKELFQRHTGESVPGDLDGDGIPDDQQQSSPNPVAAAEPVNTAPNEESAPNADAEVPNEDEQVPENDPATEGGEPAVLGAQPAPVDAAPTADAPAGDADVSGQAVADEAPASEEQQSPEPSAQVAEPNPVDAAEKIVGNQSAESVTGAQDVVVDTNGEAPITRGIFPENTDGVKQSGVPADHTIAGKPAEGVDPNGGVEAGEDDEAKQ